MQRVKNGSSGIEKVWIVQNAVWGGQWELNSTYYRKLNQQVSTVLKRIQCCTVTEHSNLVLMNSTEVLDSIGSHFLWGFTVFDIIILN